MLGAKDLPHTNCGTAASLAVSVGANVKAVQRMLGHKSAAMTLDVYSGLFDADLEAVAYRLDAAADVYPVCTGGEVVAFPGNDPGFHRPGVKLVHHVIDALSTLSAKAPQPAAPRIRPPLRHLQGHQQYFGSSVGCRC